MGTERAIAEIAVLVYSGAQMAEVHSMTHLFAAASRIAGEQSTLGLPRLRISHWSLPDEGPPQRSYDSLPGEDSAPLAVLLPPPFSALPEGVVVQRMSRWIQELHSAGATIGSVCQGAFLLAETGLLNGRPATTHWNSAQRLADRYPGIKVQTDSLVVDDGDVITTAGLMAWSALGLRMVERLLGPDVVTRTARFLVAEHSNGSACECGNNFAPIFSHGDAAVLSVQHWLQASGALDITLTALAGRSGLGERTFLRRFREATGLKPTQYYQHLRVIKARQMLESSDSTVDQIAWLSGYQDVGWFRVNFRKITGMSPSDYRSRFGRLAA